MLYSGANFIVLPVNIHHQYSLGTDPNVILSAMHTYEGGGWGGGTGWGEHFFVHFTGASPNSEWDGG